MKRTAEEIEAKEARKRAKAAKKSVAMPVAMETKTATDAASVISAALPGAVEGLVAGDIQIACKDCDSTFTFTAAEQAAFALRGFAAKTRCRDCTKAKKARYAEIDSGVVAEEPAASLPSIPVHDAKIEAKLDAWVAAKRAKDFENADRLRYELRRDGINPDECRPVGRQQQQHTPPQRKTKCFNCGETGHRSAECPKPAGLTSCHLCGAEDHLSKACPKAEAKAVIKADVRQSRCFNCGREGHLSKDCTSAVGKGSSACYLCGEEGHLSRFCPSVARSKKAKKSPKPPGACFAFQKGECQRGAACYFAHVISSA